MSTYPLLTVLLLAACTKKSVTTLDLDLPEKLQTFDSSSPRAMLEDAAQLDQPSPRGQALRFLILTDTSSSDSWAARALFDPDAWVQRQGVSALLQRGESAELLASYIQRPTADPYSRGYAALRLASEPAIKAATAEAWKAETERWRIAPLALAALAQGVQDAEEPLIAALSRGDIALEESFISDVGASRSPALRDALREGQTWVEEELSIAYAAARVQLGDRAGIQVLRAALQTDQIGAQLDALTHLAALTHPDATALLRRAKASRFPLISATAELLLAATPGQPLAPFKTYAASPDDEIREACLQAILMRIRDPHPRTHQAPTLRDLLRAGLIDPDSEVRNAALHGLAALHPTPEEITPLLQDQSRENRLLAAGILLLHPVKER